MPSIADTKKIKQRLKGLFKSSNLQSPGASTFHGTDANQNDSIFTTLRPINRLNTPNDDISSSSSAPTREHGDSIARSGLDDDVEIIAIPQFLAERQGPETIGSPVTQSDIKSGLELGGRFVQTLLKKLPDCVDSNPVKMALSIVKTIILIKDEIGDNKDALTEGLQSTSLLLGDAIGKVDSEDMEDVKREIESYKRKIDEQNTQLLQITRELESTLRYLDYENFKKKIMKICKAINETTTVFVLNMQIEIRKTTAKMHEQLKQEQKARLQEQKERQTMSLRDLNPSRKADHKSSLEGHTLKRETCTEGTRVKILEDITMWANDGAQTSPHVFWLTGQAGSGKTTITYTIAKHFEKVKDQSAVLASNFLCSRQFDETRSLSRIIPTIVYQLAGACEPYEEALHDYVKDKSAVVDHDISEQMEELLVKPWNAAQFSDKPTIYLIVIDALDEISEDGGSRFLRLLLSTINKHNFHNLKFLVTSRTDPQIVQLCDTFDSKTVCRLQDVPTEEATNDIKKYLDIKLPKLIGSHELTDLAERASGLFIYASTSVRILTTPSSLTLKQQMRRLSDLLSKPSGLSAVGQNKSPIDGLYEQILDDAFSNFNEEEFAARLRILFTFLCAGERISLSIAATLMGDDEELAEILLNDLHAVLYIRDDCVFWYHASFPDFIMERNRSNFRLAEKQVNFWCDQANQHSLLASSCFRIMASNTSGLKFNMGGITSSYLLDSECIDEISINVKKNISPALRYACLYWGHHLLSSFLSNTDNEPFDIPLSEFLQIRVLFWIEAMNLLKANNRCVPNLHQARRWVLKARFLSPIHMPLVYDLLESANFATYFTSSAASESTPHLYISSLATWKSESTLTKSWRNQFLCIPHFTYAHSGYDVPLLTVDLKAPVFSTAFSNDGTRIVAGLRDSTAQIIDASTGKVSRILAGHSDWVNSVLFSNDDKWIASASKDCTVRLWDAYTGICLKELKGHADHVASVAISPNDTLIASGSYDNSIRLWDASTGNVVNIFKGHTNHVNSVSFSKNNTRIVSGSDDRSVRIWDVSSGQELLVIEGHTDVVNSVVYGSNHDEVISVSRDESVRVWETGTGVEMAALRGHSQSVTSVRYFDSAFIVLSGSWDESVRIWDITTGRTLGVFKGHNQVVHSVGYSHDPRRVVSGSGDGIVRVWSLQDVLKIENIDGVLDDPIASPVTSVAFSMDQGQVIFGCHDGSVHIWDLSTLQELRVFMNSTERVTTVAVSNSGLLFGWATWQELWVWDVSTDEAVMIHKFHHDHAVRFVGFSREEKLTVLASTPRGPAMWNDRTRMQSQFLTDLGHSQSLGLSQEGKHIVSGFYSDSTRVWVVSSGEILSVMKGHHKRVGSVGFSDDASLLVSGSEDRTVRIWDALSGSELKVLHGHNDWASSVAFASDNTRVVSGSHDFTVRIWDVHTGREMSNLRGRHTRYVNSIAVSSDSRFVISGSEDGSVIIWDLEEPPWYLADANWISSSSANVRLMWVPPNAQVLQRPNCRILVGRSLYSTVDFEQAMLAIGPTWEKCYTPNTLPP